MNVREQFDVTWDGSIRPLEPFIPWLPQGAQQSTTPPWRSVRVTKICAGCGQSYRVRPSHAAARHHCSVRCRHRSVFKVCPWCLTTFEVAFQKRRQTHCSRICQAAWSADRRGRQSMQAMGRLGGLKSGETRRRQIREAAHG